VKTRPLVVSVTVGSVSPLLAEVVEPQWCLADRVKLLLQFSDLLVCFVFKFLLKYNLLSQDFVRSMGAGLLIDYLLRTNY
jgi:hypothetical protein